jgi:integrase
MARQVNRLNARAVATLAKPGRHADGGGLYLNVTPSGARSWLFMWKAAGRRREIGLGSARDVTLAEARDKAAAARRSVLNGIDPTAQRRSVAMPSFGSVADALIESMAPAWRNAKHRAQWEMTLRVYCEPIRSMPVDRVGTEDVLRVLRPIWLEKPETASRLRGRIERVLDFARARGLRSTENPARWRGHLDAVLPRRARLSRGHHKALAFAELPAFIRRLREIDGMAARALEFTILTAARSGETLGARWSEIDLAAAVWTVPANRMKGGREHRVPLSAPAMALLGPLSEARIGEFVFPGAKPGRPLSVMAMEMVLRRAGMDVTVHGFRSAFRDWAGERTSFPRDVAEMALAHKVGNEVELAYRRGDALDKRRRLMEAWGRFCVETGRVISLAG